MGIGASSPEEAPPSFNDCYTLGKMVGKGSQGRVHLCVDKRTGILRAVKIIDRTAKTAEATYRREVDLSKATCSRNVISVVEEFMERSHCYVVMEKFEGHLRKGLKWVAKEGGSLQGKGLGDAPLRLLVQQALSGILHLHNCCIVHRDVKAHNLFIDRLDVRDCRCRAVLGDLGLARRLEHGRVLCAQVGTRKYWAPELYGKKYWHVVDIFALGVLVFLAAASTYPYIDEQQTCTRDVFADGGVPDSLVGAARDFLLKTLTKDPARRPGAAELFRHPWLASGASGGDAVSGEVDGHGLCGRSTFGPKVSSPNQGAAYIVSVPGDLCDDIEGVDDMPRAVGYGDDPPSNEDAVPAAGIVEASELELTPPRTGHPKGVLDPGSWRKEDETTPSTATTGDPGDWSSLARTGASAKGWGPDLEDQPFLAYLDEARQELVLDNL